MNWSDVSFSIDGVSFPVEGVTYERSREPAYGFDVGVLRRDAGSYEVSCTVPLKNGIQDFASLFHREPPGASAATLARRVGYGGRKGRSALRRLLRRGLPIEFATASGLRMRGRAAMLSAHEMVVELRGGSAPDRSKADAG